MSPEPPSIESVPVVRLDVVEAEETVLEIRAVAEPITALEESKTETLIPSKPSLSESTLGVTVNVTEVSPAANVTIPERDAISEFAASSTVPPLSSPITLYVNEASEVEDEDAEAEAEAEVAPEPNEEKGPEDNAKISEDSETAKE